MCFSVAEVMVVSMVAVLGRALVMVVSRWPASVAAEVSLVSTSPRHSCLCAKKFALLGLMVARARKSSPCARKMAHNRRFMACRANLFRGLVGERVCRANFVAYTGTVARYHRGCGALHAGNGGGFALHEALWPRVARVSEPHVVQFPRVVAGVVCVLAEVLAAGPFDWQC